MIPVALFQGLAEGSEAGGRWAARPSSSSVSKAWMSRGRVVSVHVCCVDQKGWTWSSVELLYLFTVKLKTVVTVPIYFQEKRGTLKESDKAVMTAFDAIVNFCEELG